MTSATTAENVDVIDTKMFGFDRFNAVYLVVGKEAALIDTGAPLSWAAMQEAIGAHGFALGDVDHIFVTPAEHPDHSGNAGVPLKENNRAAAFVNPIGGRLRLTFGLPRVAVC